MRIEFTFFALKDLCTRQRLTKCTPACRREIHTIRFVPPPGSAENAPLGVVSGAEDGTIMRLLYDATRRDGARVYSTSDVCKHTGGRTVKSLSIYKEHDHSYVL